MRGFRFVTHDRRLPELPPSSRRVRVVIGLNSVCIVAIHLPQRVRSICCRHISSISFCRLLWCSSVCPLHHCLVSDQCRSVMPIGDKAHANHFATMPRSSRALMLLLISCGSRPTSLPRYMDPQYRPQEIMCSCDHPNHIL